MRFDQTVPQPSPTQVDMSAQPSSTNDTIGRNLELIGDEDDDIIPNPIIAAPSQPPRRYPDRLRQPPSWYGEYIQH